MPLFDNRPVKSNRSRVPQPQTAMPALPAPTAQPLAAEIFNADGRYIAPPEFKQVREELQQFLIDEVKSLADLGGTARLRQLLEPLFTKSLADAHLVISRAERTYLFDMLIADIFGYGPIQPLLDRDDISEVMVNGPNQVYIEQKGKLILTHVKFIDDAQVLQVIERIVTPLGRRIDEASPMVDARLPDGSRVNAIIPPLSLIGPCLTIRKFRKDPLKIEELIRFGSVTAEFAQFINACVVGPAQHHRQRRYWLWQDHDAQCALQLYPRRRPRCHD